MSTNLYAIVKDVDGEQYHIWQAEHNQIKNTIRNISYNRCTSRIAVETPRTAATFIKNFQNPNYICTYNGTQTSGFLGFRENIDITILDNNIWFTQADARTYASYMGLKVCDSCIRLLYKPQL